VPYASVNNQRLYFEDTGGDGPAIVFSHGFLMDHEMFASQRDALQSHWRVITWDWRCFGLTETDGAPFTVWDHADDLLGLLDHLGVNQAVVAGMSHGGYIAMRAALKAPERVRALILIDTNAAGLTDEEKVGYQQMFDAWVSNGPTDELTQTFANIIIGHPAYDEVWKDKWKARPQDLMREAGQCTIGAEDIRPRLGEIACPALVIHAEADVAFPLSAAEDIARGLPAAGPVVRVPGGHAAAMTHPEAVNDAIEKFLAGL
jgi:pimeloyl-ACP methyl ester carboxylesterase